MEDRGVSPCVSRADGAYGLQPVRHPPYNDRMPEERSWSETINVEAGQLLNKVQQLVREGNVRRIVIRQGDRTIAEFPLTIGVVGAVFAPILAAVGAMAALLTECSIVIERVDKPAGSAGDATSLTPQD